MVVDDQALVRAGIAAVVDAEPDLTVVGEAADGVRALAAVERLRPDVVLMDVRMPGMDGLAATARLTGPGGAGASVTGASDAGKSVRVLVLTTFDLDEDAEIGVELGVRPSTVKAHMNAILAKLRLRDRVQATIFAYDAGLVRPGER